MSGYGYKRIDVYRASDHEVIIQPTGRRAPRTRKATFTVYCLECRAFIHRDTVDPSRHWDRHMKDPRYGIDLEG